MEDAGNTRKRDMHFQLEQEYAPLLKNKGKEQKQEPAIQMMMQQYRLAGAKNVDLWVEGSLYPPDPLTKTPPSFSGLTSFMKYVCEGQQGLWGYTTRLANLAQQWFMSSQRLSADHQRIVMELRSVLEAKESECHRLQDVVHDIQIQNAELSNNVENMEKLQQKLRTRLQKQTTLGPRERVRNLKPMVNLVKGSGQWKRRIRRCKSFTGMLTNTNDGIDPCINKVLTKDMVKIALQSKKFKSVSDEWKRECMQKVGETFTPQDAQSICDTIGMSQKSYATFYKQLDVGFRKVFHRKRVLPMPRPSSVKQARNDLNMQLLDLIGEPLHLTHTHLYYTTITQGTSTLDASGKKTNAKGKANAKGAREPESCNGTRGTTNVLKEMRFDLHERNNFVFNVQKLQAAMVQFYNITVEECSGLLKFVIKLDESEIIKGQKLERISLTLMNRALDPTITSTDPRYFSVQSENDIWWLAAFELSKEDHEILKVFFNLTEIPEVVRRQTEGELLYVEGYGEYRVEWHLACDLKTLKCMYGVSNAANARNPCLYCMTSRVKNAQGNKQWNTEGRIDDAPNRDGSMRMNGEWKPRDEKWDPILPIPLTRVHFCTLHAFVRITEKLIYEYIRFAYNMQPKTESLQVCKNLEKALSEIGLHGGNVQIKKDEKKSGASGDVPTKPCLGGAKARKFFAAPVNDDGEIVVRFPERYDSWKKVHYAVPDRTNGGRTRLAKANVWIQFNKLALLLQKMKFTPEDSRQYEAVANEFYNSMVEAWGAHNITPYIHILTAHGPYFAKQGSLAIWSTQGMERSHWQARCGYQRATDHGGGHGHQRATEPGNERSASNPMLQLVQWWYRRIQVRYEKNVNNRSAQEDPVVDEAAVERQNRKKSAYDNSNAREKHALWRQNCVREGRTWIHRVDDQEEIQDQPSSHIEEDGES